MIRKRLLSACLALALCLSLLPATALAAAPSGQVLYVGNVQISSTGYWTTSEDGQTITSVGDSQPSSGGYIHYDADTNTLTLHNATIKESVSTETNSFIAGAAIGVHNQRGAAELTITLEGTNTIAEVGKGIYVLASSTGEATLTITSESGGSLDASGSSNPGIWVQSNNGDAALFIQNAKVEATGTSYGVNVQSHKSSTAALTVDGGSLTASGSPGILYDSISSGTVPKTTSLTISNSAIVDARGGGIGAGLLQDLKEVSPADDSVGIVFGHDRSDSKAGTVYGSVTLQENLTIESGQTLTIPDGASLDTNGKLTVDGGTLTQNGTVTGDVTYKVTGVSLSPTTLTLDVGASSTLTATITPDNASNKSINWESGNTGVATVDTSGKVTAVAQGTTTITATAADGSGKSAECSVTVKEAANVPVESVSLDKTSLGLTEGETTQLTATVEPEDASNKNVTWESSNTNVATVNNGEVTAVSAGTATITVTTVDGGKTDTCTVTVREEAPDRPVNLPDTHSIDLIVSDGGEAKLSLTNASAGSTITVTATPDEGFKLDYITVDGERIDGTTFTMPAHDVTVRVYFTDGAALPFTDVSAGAWYYDAVGYVYVGGLMDGVSDTLFDPDGTMTRAMVWAILARVDGETVTGDGWIETAREWAVAEGVSDGENANGYVTREQLATMLWRYASGKGYDVSIGEDTNILSYADFADLSEYAIPAMQWACGAGVITGVTDATLVPQGEATRAQCAAMLMRFCEAIG